MAQGDEDPQSPTVMIQSYLRGKGLQPTAQNVHNVLMAQASGMRVIPGLDTQAPPGDPGVGQSAPTVAGKIEARGGPASTGGAPTSTQSSADSLPSRQPSVRPGESSGGGDGSPTTSAQPDNGMHVSLGDAITLGLPALGAAGAGYGAYRYMNRPNYQLELNKPGTDVATVDDSPPQLRPTDPALPPPDQPSVIGDQYRSGGADQTSPMDLAMQKAIEGPTPITGVRPVVNPADVIGKPGLPPGVSDVDAANAALRGTPTGPIANTPIAPPRVPITPKNPATYIRPSDVMPQSLRPASRLFTR